MKGKDQCKLLQSIRQEIATQYQLSYQPTLCRHKGPCLGTCPACDAELVDLQMQLLQKGITEVEVNEAICQQVRSFGEALLKKSIAPKGIPIKSIEDNICLGRPAFNGVDPYEYWRFEECHLVGWRKLHPEKFWSKLYEGAKLDLIHREKDKDDPYKIAVSLRLSYPPRANAEDTLENSTTADGSSLIIGYLPRPLCKKLLPSLEMYSAELTTILEQGSSKEQLRISVYYHWERYGF